MGKLAVLRLVHSPTLILFRGAPMQPWYVVDEVRQGSGNNKRVRNGSTYVCDLHIELLPIGV